MFMRWCTSLTGFAWVAGGYVKVVVNWILVVLGGTLRCCSARCCFGFSADFLGILF